MVPISPRALGSTLAASLVCALVYGSPALARASQPCAQQVLRDWSDDGMIGGSHDASCYRGALRALPEDVRLYSSATDDIRRALAHRVSTRSVALAHRRHDGAGTVQASGGGGGFPGAPLGLAAVLTGLGLLAGLVFAVVLRRGRRRQPGLPA